MSETNTGGGLAVGGDVGTGGGNFTGRDHSESDANANVSVYFQNPPPYQEERRSISVTVEESLRVEIRELRSAITNLTDSVSKLDKTVALSGAESESVKSQVRTMSVEIKSADVRLTALSITWKSRLPSSIPKCCATSFTPWSV
jgi:hypothetical protein